MCARSRNGRFPAVDCQTTKSVVTGSMGKQTIRNIAPSAALVGLLFLLTCRFGAAESLQEWIDANCQDCLQRMEQHTGAYILERGDEHTSLPVLEGLLEGFRESFLGASCRGS